MKDFALLFLLVLLLGMAIFDERDAPELLIAPMIRAGWCDVPFRPKPPLLAPAPPTLPVTKSKDGGIA